MNVLLVIGGERCGTTYLYDCLCRYEQFSPPTEEKECHYFCHFFDHEDPLGGYLKNFSAYEGKTLLDVTPHYLYHHLAAWRASKTIPQAKIVALLRNPVDRFLSMYEFNRKRGDTSSLEWHLNHMWTHMNKGAWGSNYLHRGLYFEQLLRWGFYYPQGMMLIRSEDFFADPKPIVEKVVAYAGIEPNAHPDLPTPPDPNDYTKLKEEHPEAIRKLEEFYAEPNQMLVEWLRE